MSTYKAVFVLLEFVMQFLKEGFEANRKTETNLVAHLFCKSPHDFGTYLKGNDSET